MNKNGKVIANYLERVQEYIRTNKNVIIKSLEQVVDNKDKIKGLGNNYKGDQLEREISNLLNADVQKENISSNSVSKKPLAPPWPSKKRNSDSEIPADDENKKPARTQTFSLAQVFKAIKVFFKDCAKKIIDAICNLFKREVATKIGEQGYNVSSKQGSSEITIEGSKPIDAQKIKNLYY